MAYDPRPRNQAPAAYQEEPAPRTGRGRRRGPHIGPFAITPARVFLPIALAGSLAYLIYATTVRSTSQIPALAVGAGVLGLVFGALALAGFAETIRSSRRGAAGRSVIAAVFGGFAGVVALGCAAAAAILVMLAQSGSPP